MLHVGPVASGKSIALDDQLRQEYASRNGILAFDSDLETVVESIYGNRKDQYTLIRGMADYRDGTRRKEWQQYASLMAASVLKAIVEEIVDFTSHFGNFYLSDLQSNIASVRILFRLCVFSLIKRHERRK